MPYNKSPYNLFVTHPFKIIDVKGEASFKVMEMRHKIEYMITKEGLQMVFSSPSEYYDPFEKRVNAKSKTSPYPPYIEFANLDPSDLNILLNYANTRGLPVSETADIEYLPYSGIREEQIFDATNTNQHFLISTIFSHPPIYSVYKFQREIIKMRAILKLKGIITGDILVKSVDEYDSICFDAGLQSQRFEIRNIFNKIKKDNPTIEDDNSNIVRQVIKSMAKRALRDVLKKEMFDVYPTIGIYRQDINRVILCKNLLQTLYTTLYEDIAVRSSICADPNCGEYFVVKRDDKIYCSPACANRVARRSHYWNKERPARIKKTKGGSHGKTKRKG